MSIVVIGCSTYSLRVRTLLAEQGFVVRHQVFKIFEWSRVEALLFEDDVLLPVTEFNCVVLTQISEPEFRLVLYERGTVTQ